MGFDSVKEKLDAESVSLPYSEGLKTRTCRRCGQPFWMNELIKIGEGERYYCTTCYDRPYGEGQHRRGDE
jgi:hypothetical protein